MWGAASCLPAIVVVPGEQGITVGVWGVPAVTPHVLRHAVGVQGTGVVAPSIKGNSLVMQGCSVGVGKFHVVVWVKLGATVVGPGIVS